MAHRTMIVMIASAALGGCGQGQDDAPANSSATELASTSPVAAAGARPSSFAICGTCHAVEDGKNGIGPSLFGVVGRAAAAVPGYKYSPALESSALVWTEENLDRFILDPRAVIPGTKMAYAGNKDAAKRREIIDYLATLK